MPVVGPTPPTFDPAVQASKLPAPFQWLGGAMGSVAKDATGASDPNSALMGVASPLAAMGEGSPLVGELAKRAVSKIKSIQHPAVQELLWFLGNAKVGGGEEGALKQALASRVTPRFVKPSQEITLPSGWVLKGKMPTGTQGGALTYPLGESTVAPLAQPSRRLLSGAAAPGALARLSQAGLTEDMIKDIRGIGSIPGALKTYPHLNPNTVYGILKDGAFGWVK